MQQPYFHAFGRSLLLLAFVPLLGAPMGVYARATTATVERTVYDKQGPVTENDLARFLTLLPKFRAWALENREEAHPFLTNAKPDFHYSRKAADWIKKNGWDPRRFFCVMGKMAAALVIIEEGNDWTGTRPPDMPAVSEQELQLANRHLAELLQAGGATAPTVAVEAPKLPQK